jgi:transcription initiation factor TFIID subunit 8
MLSARRSQPIPVDFEYALRHEGLTASLLKPHLKTPISTAKLQPVFLPPPPAQEIIHRPVAKLLGKELDGDSDKRTKAYIPKKFPSFPSKHTYKSTEVKSDRETDPRKIREKATEEARHGEEALRRLVKVEKAGDQRVIGKDSAKVSKQGTSHQMWEITMKELANGKKRTRSSGGDERDEEQSIMVNAAKQYGRTTPARKKH